MNYISLSLLLSVSSYGMYQENIYNMQDLLGRTPLHVLAITLNPLEKENNTAIDNIKAATAAAFIMRGNASVLIRDNNEQTPFDWAKYYKVQYPALFEVMRAGKIKQAFENKNSKFSKSISHSIKEKCTLYNEAIEILNSYLPSDKS
jgi:hypothetical protein